MSKSSPLKHPVEFENRQSTEEDASLVEESRQSAHNDRRSIDQSNEKASWLSPTSVFSTSPLPAWFRGGSDKGRPLLPMPVQGGREDTHSRDGDSRIWLLRFAVALLAACLVALIWLIAISGHRPPPPPMPQWSSSSDPLSSSVPPETNTKTYSLEESVYNETLGVSDQLTYRCLAELTSCHSSRRSSSSTCSRGMTSVML